MLFYIGIVILQSQTNVIPPEVIPHCVALILIGIISFELKGFYISFISI